MTLDKSMNTLLLGLLKKTHHLVFNTQMAHWLTSGPTFYSWHELFEKHYKQLLSLLDQIAEGILIEGGALETSLSYYNAQEAAFPKDAKEQLIFLMHNHEEILTLLKELSELSKSLNYEVIEDLLIDHRATHQKILWFYKALKI